MKIGEASEMRAQGVSTLELTLNHTLDVAKRALMQVSQITMDLFIYWVCMELVLKFRDYPPEVFLPERKLFFCGIILISFYFRGLYQFRTWMFWDEMRAVLNGLAAVLLIILSFLFALKISMPRLAIVAGLALFLPNCLAARYFLRRALFSLGMLRTPILVIGAAKTGELYARKVKRHPFMGCEIVAFLDDDPSKKGTLVAGIPVLGGIADFPAVQRDLGVSEVVIAISTASRELLAQILQTVEMRVKRVSYIPDMYMLTTFSASIRDVDGVPMISASQGLLNPFNRALKSVMDYVGAVLALILFSPVFLYATWRIKRDDGGRAFFQHNRVGRDLAPFKMHKFRTMLPNAESILEEMLKDDEKRREFEVAFKFKDDPRITRVGKFLRKTSLDEVPQIFNVLKGEMSLIGPRPIVKKEVELYYGEEIARQIFRVKPGVTGFWQVSGRNDVQDYQTRIDLDLYYIHNWSLWLDIVILFRTVQILINANGAY